MLIKLTMKGVIMKKAMLLSVLALSISSSVYAGAKEDFIKAVKAQCGKSEEEASKLATPGRAGNVMKLKSCTTDSITVGDCTLNCKDASASIGG